MEIRRAKKEDLDQIYDFNHRMYPERNNYKEIVDFWIAKSPVAINDIVVAVDENGRVRGQQFFSSMSYFRDSKEINSSWAFDLIVDEELRSGSQGFSLMWKCKKIHPGQMSSGSNDVSLPINLKIGNKHVGDLKKFVGVANPLWLCTSVFRGNIAPDNYPDVVKVKDVVYKKVYTVDDLNDRIKAHNSSLLEFSRNKDFLAWRYFSGLHEYVIYKKEGSDDYFVVRTIVKKHITSLVLIDFRCQLSDILDFESIILAFRKLASKLKLSLLIVGSSMAIVDEVCSKYSMRAVGRDRPILGMIDCDNADEVRKKRNFVLLTLADSDGDITW